MDKIAVQRIYKQVLRKKIESGVKSEVEDFTYNWPLLDMR